MIDTSQEEGPLTLVLKDGRTVKAWPDELQIFKSKLELPRGAIAYREHAGASYALVASIHGRSDGLGETYSAAPDARTMAPLLEAQDLVNALDLLDLSRASPGRYLAVGVFADDISASARFDVASGKFVANGYTYGFAVYPDRGSVCLTRQPSGPISKNDISRAVAKAREQSIGVVHFPVVALLTGEMLGTPRDGEAPSRRVFPLQIDPQTRKWRAYTEGLLGFMKLQLFWDGDSP